MNAYIITAERWATGERVYFDGTGFSPSKDKAVRYDEHAAKGMFMILCGNRAAKIEQAA